MTKQQNKTAKQSPAEKAFYVLKKNINLWDMKDLIVLLENEIERQNQELMMEGIIPLKGTPDDPR